MEILSIFRTMSILRYLVMSSVCGGVFASPSPQRKPIAARNLSGSPCAIVSSSASAALVASPSGKFEALLREYMTRLKSK